MQDRTLLFSGREENRFILSEEEKEESSKLRLLMYEQVPIPPQLPEADQWGRYVDLIQHLEFIFQ